MSVKNLSDYTFYSRYAKYLPEKKRRETWDESINRVFGMHEVFFKDILAESEVLKDYFNVAKTAYLKKRVLGSQRALQFGGDPILNKNMRLFNCSTTHINRTKAFQEAMWVLLCGTGLGFSVQKHHVKQLPTIQKPNEIVKKFIIPDNIEGWADAIGIIVNSYFSESESCFPEYSGYKVEFDYSKIRPEGSFISGGFKAPGPKGLRNSIEKIRELIDKRISDMENDEFRNKMRPIDCFDIVCFAAEAVLSGGVRRSALLTLFSPDDRDMSKAKTGNWFVENPQRGRSNNSAALNKKTTTREEFAGLMESTRTWGEPGFVWMDDPEIVYNPCCISESSLIPTSEGLYSPSKKNVEEVIVNSQVRKTDSGFFENGEKEVFKFELANGMELNLTADHRILTKDHGFKEVMDIAENGYDICINKNFDVDISVDENSSDFKLGYLLGSFVGDGCITRSGKSNRKQAANLTFWGKDNMFYKNMCQEFIQELKLSRYKPTEKFKNSQSPTSRDRAMFESIGLLEKAIEKGVYDKINNIKQFSYESFNGSYNYVSGLLSGYFDADGSVTDSSITLASSNLQNLKIAQIALNSMGVSSKITKSRDEQIREFPFENKEPKNYNCKVQYVLFIHKHCFKNFYKNIILLNKDKREKSKNLLSEKSLKIVNKTLYTKIEKYFSKGIEKVYDISVPDGNMFSCNGLLVHNCEIGMIPISKSGEHGVQVCNLTEINGKYCTTKERFLEACKASAIIGTLQAAYTKFDYLSDASQEICDYEALLGCSITGVNDNPEILLDPEIQKEGAELIKKINKEVALIIGINQSARTTCIKPSGSTSCLLETASGIHPHHAKRYLRRVQANKSEFPLQYFKEKNPSAVEESVWSSNKTDDVITFVCEVPDGAKTKNQIKAIDLLKQVKLTQQNWVEFGTNEDIGYSKRVRHNVSNTISILDEQEWVDVEEFIWENRQWFAGISLLSATGDLDYAQAPFATVLTPTELVREFGDASVFASGLVVDGLRAFDGNLWRACDAALGLGETVEEQLEEPKYPIKRNNKDLAQYFIAKELYENWFFKKDWIRRLHQFGEKYFDGDSKRASYCLKYCSLWKTFVDLSREYKDVDWSQAVEAKESLIAVDTMTASACAGGKCLIDI